MFLLETIHLISLFKFLPINSGTVKIRAVDTTEFYLAKNAYPAATAHSGSIHHKRIKRDQLLKSISTRGKKPDSAL